MLNRLFLYALAAMASGSAFAAGYEKAIMWGGRSAGVAGIASPYVRGPSALYFNPAGLAGDKQGMGIDANLTALQAKFKGPIDNTNEQKESTNKVLTPFSLIFGQTLNEKFGYGVGAYVSAGSQAKYEDITVASSTGNTVQTDLTVIEFAGGVAYKVMENLRVGAAYRILMTDGTFSFIQRASSTNIVTAELKDLKGMNYDGYKIGAQYDLSEKTKIGLSYRSQVDIVAKGKLGGRLKTAGPEFALDANDATVKTTLPQAVTLGVEHACTSSLKTYAEYVWTQYSKVDHVTLDGAVTRSGGTPLNPANPDAADLEQGWHDQHQVKLAGEYLGLSMPVRMGYIWTSQVTNDDFARATFTAPGNAHTFTLGTGYAFNERMRLDGALDYTMIKGKSNGGTAGSLTQDVRAGEHETTAYALHLGMAFDF